MKRKICLLTVSLLFMMTFTAHAAQARLISPIINLRFEDSTALCSAVLTSAGDEMVLDLQLWHGDTLIKSWPASGNSVVTVSGSCPVTKGQTYDLFLTGTINGQSYTSPSVSRTC